MFQRCNLWNIKEESSTSSPQALHYRPVHGGGCALCSGQSLGVGGTLTNLEATDEDAEEHHEEGLGIVPHTILGVEEKDLQ